MRRTISVLLATLACLLMATPVTASPMWHFSISGRSAHASFLVTRPGSSSEPPYLMVRTDIMAGERVDWTDHSTYATTQLFVIQHTSGSDNGWDWYYVSEVVGYADGDAVTFSADSRLNRASAAATVTLATCGEESCQALGTADVRAIWTGLGDLTRGVGNSVSISGSMTFATQGRYVYRDATAAVSIAGAEIGVGETVQYASARIEDARSANLAVCHLSC
jgi:hypothetical protein